MADSENQKRPTRRLTVENFSVIKHAELEFGKITVLIGPQASGKSLLCKLAYFLSKKTIDLTLAAILRKDTFEEFKTDFIKEFLEWFPIETWVRSDSTVRFKSSDFTVQVAGFAGGDSFYTDSPINSNHCSLTWLFKSEISLTPDRIPVNIWLNRWKLV